MGTTSAAGTRASVGSTVNWLENTVKARPVSRSDTPGERWEVRPGCEEQTGNGGGLAWA